MFYMFYIPHIFVINYIKIEKLTSYIYNYKIIYI